jgi:phage terminase large subunit
MYYTANPGGVGHAWFKRLFVDKNYRGSENKADYNFIPARIYDNPQLMQNNPEYLDNLKALPDELRRAHLDGDWNVYSGQFFPEFRAEIHTTRPFKIPHHWRRFASLDYGMDMTACLFYAVSDDQEVYIYKEVYEQGLTLSQAAEKIQEYIAENEQIDYITASPDLWNSRQESGISGNQIMANAGLRGLIRANDNRIAGWRIVREYLNKPNKFKIFSNCINLIRCLPQLRYDKIRIEDAANNPHEVTHAPESLRYGLCSIPIKTKLDAIKSGFYTETEKEDFWQQKGFQIRKI